MIIETNNNVFGCQADAIVNTVNCVGFMGKGLALEFALRYPALEEAYIADCKAKRVHTGKINAYQIEGQTILNFPTKFHFKYPSQMSWIEEGLADFIRIYKTLNIKSVAFPLLGASNGGLDSVSVLQLMKERLDAAADLTIYICHSKNPDALETKMISKFNSMSVESIARQIRLSTPQKESLAKAQNHIAHFFEIARLPKIGDATYRALFALCKKDDGESAEPTQLRLF